MDNKEIQEPAKDTDIVTVMNENDENTEPSSRFSRRRFLRSAAISSPILLSIKSPSAWGGGLYNDQCSIVTHISGNASHPNGCQTSAKDPRYWINTFTGNNDIVKQEVNKQGCYSSTLFHTLFPHHLHNYKMNTSVSKKWQYKTNSASDNPPLLQGLSSSGWRLILEFENTKNGKKKQINILHNVPTFHCCLISGYLNGLFHPSPVNYIGDSNLVRNAFMAALTRSADIILEDLQNRRFDGVTSKKYSQEMNDLSAKLNTWDTL